MGNDGTGLLRKRARGIRDAEYFNLESTADSRFKLKTRQLGPSGSVSIFYNSSS